MLPVLPMTHLCYSWHGKDHVSTTAGRVCIQKQGPESAKQTAQDANKETGTAASVVKQNVSRVSSRAKKGSPLPSNYTTIPDVLHHTETSMCAPLQGESVINSRVPESAKQTAKDAKREPSTLR